MNKISKLFCLTVAVLLLVTLVPITGFAEEKPVMLQYPEENPPTSGNIALVYPEDYTAPTESVSGENLNDYLTDDFLSYLLSQFALCKTNFRISQYDIPVSLNSQLTSYIWYELPEAFHVWGLGMSDDMGCLDTIYVSYREYADTIEEYQSCNAAMKAGADELLQGIENNPALTDVEKALLLHDRLATWIAYDYENYLNGTLPKTVYSAYGALGQQKAVCQGYAMAYIYLLKRVDIESDYCSSDNMNHGWNIVYIDGQPYHVDVTWDDPVWDMVGYVKHDNFLRSTAGIVKTGHHGGDFTTTPTSTLYDNYYWQSSNSSFALAYNELYFFNDDDNTLCHADGTTITPICSMEEDHWDTERGGYWTGMASLTNAGDLLLFSRPKGIYALDPVTGVQNFVFAPNLSASKYLSIYGFEYERGTLICYIAEDHSHDQITADMLVTKAFMPDTSRRYTVTFQSRNGTVLSSKTYTYGQIVIPPMLSTQPDANGYFPAWDKEVTVCLGNATYTETTKRPKDHMVQYVDWDGTPLLTTWYDYGEEIVHPQMNLQRAEDDEASYEYIGWYAPESWVGDAYGKCTGDMVIEACYIKQYKQYTVVFYDWDGSEIGYSNGLFWNEDISSLVPTGLTRPDDQYYTYEFAGWDQEVSLVCKGNAVYHAVYTATAKPQPKNGWVRESGNWYYYQNDVKKTGWLQDGSTWYYLDSDGVMVTGEYVIDGKRHMFATSGAWLGEVHVHSFTTYKSDENATCTADGTKTAKCDGCDETDTVADVGSKLGHSFTSYKSNNDATCTVDGTETAKCDRCTVTHTRTDVDSKLGHSFTNYVSDNNATAEADGTKTAKCDRCTETDTVTDPGTKLGKNGWVQESGKWYYYKNGTKQTGWVLDGKTWYYMNKDGVMQTGWLQEGSTWYYLNASGAMVTGEYKIGNVTHKFNSSGVWLGEVQQTAKNGWVLESGKWYYYQNGNKKTGWLQEGSTWYYLDANGVMVTGEYKIGNVTHKFNGSGVWLGEVQQQPTGKNGWVSESGKWYYYENGTMVKGWKAIGGVWYYLKSDGTMATGWIQVGSTWYFMNSSGAMKTGWLQQGNTWYYLQSSGAMATGSLKIGTKTYNFNSSGACLNP